MDRGQPDRQRDLRPAADRRAAQSARRRWDDAVVPPWEASAPARGGDRGDSPAAGDAARGPVGDAAAQPPAASGGGGGADRPGGRGGSGGGGSGGGGSGEPAPAPRRRSRTKIVLAVVLVLVVAACTSAGALLWYGRANIDQTAIEGISPRKGRTVTLSGGDEIEIMNVLLVGIDNPGSLTEEERARIAPDERSGRRPDVVMLAQFEVGGNGAALLSLPRDLRVELCDGNVDKINAAFAAGERTGDDPESCLVKSVSALTGVDIDHYVEVDFGGFLRVVEALGGVTMYLDAPMIDRKAHLEVSAGCVTLTPEQALGFVRSRGYDDDFGRIARQQRFLKEMLEEARRVGVVANPARLFAVVDRASGAVRTDDGLGLAEMRDLALGLRNMTSERLIAHTVPGEATMLGEVSYVIADEAEAERLYASFRDGSVLASLRGEEPGPVDASPTEARPRPTELPPIVVLNAGGVDGLASRTAELLEARGIRVAEVGNAGGEVAATEVVHGTGLETHADVLVELLGQGGVRHESGGPPLTLVIGADYDIEAVEALLADATTASLEADATEEPAAQPTAEPTVEPTAEATAEPTAEPTVEPTAEPTPSFRGAQRPADADC